MIINILLVLILGITLSSFIILNNKLFKITNILSTITSILNNESANVTTTLELFKKLVERFTEQVRVDNGHYDNIITLLKSRFKDVDNATDSIYNRINDINIDLDTLIIGEHRTTRNEIKKQAKISSKKKQTSKQSKSINKQ